MPEDWFSKYENNKKRNARCVRFMVAMRSGLAIALVLLNCIT